MNNQRTFILTAYPKNVAGELQTLFTNAEGGIKRKLEDPPMNAGKIRYSGWSLETLDQGEIIDGKFVRVRNGDRKTIDLYHDGTLIFAGLADRNFLAWASNDGLRINSMALIELVYNFVSFYREVIIDLSVKPDFVSVQFKFINMWFDNKKSYLVNGRVDDILFPFEKFPAPKDSISLEEPIDFNINDFEIEKIGETAYKVVEKIYLYFNVPLDLGNIPYIKTENSVNSVDIEEIIKK